MKKKNLNLIVVLVEPKGALNVGSIARLCSNFDVKELRIVSPKCDIDSLEAKRMALKGQRYIDNCKILIVLMQYLIVIWFLLLVGELI